MPKKLLTISDKLLKDIKKASKEHGFQSASEFIRHCIIRELRRLKKRGEKEGAKK